MPESTVSAQSSLSRRAGTRLLRGLMLVVLVGTMHGTLRADDPLDLSPVDKISEILKQAEVVQKENLKAKFQELHRKINDLTRLNQLVRVALLQEWYPNFLLNLGVDEEKEWYRQRDDILDHLIARIEKETLRILTIPNPPGQAGLLGLIRFESEKARQPEGVFGKSPRFREVVSALAPGVLAATRDSCEDVQIEAILTLGELLSKSKETAQAYTTVLGSGSVAVRRAVGLALNETVGLVRTAKVNLDLKEKAQVLKVMFPVFGKALGDADYLVRRRGANSLTNAIRFLAEQIRPMREDITRPNPEIVRIREEERQKSIRWIHTVVPELNDLAGKLLIASQDHDPVVRALAAAAIEQLATLREQFLQVQAEPKVPPPDPLDRRDRNFPDLGRWQRGSPAVALLRPVPTPADHLLQVAFVQEPEPEKKEGRPEPGKGADAKLEDVLKPTITTTLPALQQRLKDPNIRVRLFALDALEMVGDDAAPVIPDIVAALRDHDRFVRWAAARVLKGLAPMQPRLVVPALAQLLGEHDTDVRLSGIRALGAYKTEAVSTLHQLIEQLLTADVDVRDEVIKVIMTFKDAGAPAIPALIENLTYRDARVRRHAAEALGLLGPLAVKANVALYKQTLDVDAEARRRAAEALLRINPAAGLQPPERKPEELPPPERKER